MVMKEGGGDVWRRRGEAGKGYKEQRGQRGAWGWGGFDGIHYT